MWVLVCVCLGLVVVLVCCFDFVCICLWLLIVIVCDLIVWDWFWRCLLLASVGGVGCLIVACFVWCFGCGFWLVV